MNKAQQETFVTGCKQYVLEEFPLSQLEDDELEEKIEALVEERLQGQYAPIEQRIEICRQIFSAIRGFGILDTIIRDDSITEVMINGKDNIFIEQNGRVRKLDGAFESERRLEDIIQRVVGLAGREVNQASPIVDTRLPDTPPYNGSRVNVVLPPISLVGPVEPCWSEAAELVVTGSGLPAPARVATQPPSAPGAPSGPGPRQQTGQDADDVGDPVGHRRRPLQRRQPLDHLADRGVDDEEHGEDPGTGTGPPAAGRQRGEQQQVHQLVDPRRRGGDVVRRREQHGQRDQDDDGEHAARERAVDGEGGVRSGHQSRSRSDSR